MEEELLQNAFKHIDMNKFVEHVTTLSSDEFEGRFPDTVGEKLSLEYMTRAFREAGAVPVHSAESFLQPVPFVEIHSHFEQAGVHGTAANSDFPLQFPTDIAIISSRVQPRVDLERLELVWVGYGIVAPEYDWNDYAGIDVRGKVVICLVNDPGLKHSADATTFFRGRTLTYYGRWTYKYEEASRHGAAACLIVHDTAAAGYPWSVVVSGKDRPHLCLVPPDQTNAGRVAAEGWLSAEAARRLFSANGLDFEALTAKAHLRGEHRSFVSSAQFTLRLRNECRYCSSNNFVAMLPGTDRKDECVMFSAHWDHLGKKEGQGVFHGAVDNAAGVASLIELTRAIRSMPTSLSRSVLFFSATAEEQGLLGAEYYCDHPLVPLQKTVAILNFDVLNVFGATRDVSFFGHVPNGASAYRSTELHAVIDDAVRLEQRYVAADPMPAWGFYFRSDHFPFAKRGVAGLFLGAGTDNPVIGREEHARLLHGYTTNRYHKPSDVYSAEWWKLDGVLAELRLMLRIGHRLTQIKEFPKVSL